MSHVDGLRRKGTIFKGMSQHRCNQQPNQLHSQLRADQRPPMSAHSKHRPCAQNQKQDHGLSGALATH